MEEGSPTSASQMTSYSQPSVDAQPSGERGGGPAGSSKSTRVGIVRSGVVVVHQQWGLIHLRGDGWEIGPQLHIGIAGSKARAELRTLLVGKLMGGVEEGSVH